MVMSSRRHLRDVLVVIISTVTRVALDHPLLLSIMLLLLCSCYTPNSLILLGCNLWHLWTTARLVGCPHYTMVEHLSHVVCRELCSSTTILC